MRLAALSNRLLAGNQNHRHATEKTVSRTRDEVQRSGTKRGECYARFSGEPAIGSGHEGCRLLMTGHDKLDRGSPKAFDDIEVFLPGHPENAIDTLILEAATRISDPFMFSSCCSSKRRV